MYKQPEDKKKWKILGNNGKSKQEKFYGEYQKYIKSDVVWDQEDPQ